MVSSFIYTSMAGGMIYECKEVVSILKVVGALISLYVMKSVLPIISFIYFDL